ncbi:MAG: shikimate dehydrogenase [Candidatus Woesearchaeota archaeon]
MNNNYKFAVIGNPISHSRSPEIFELFAKQTGIKLVYTKIPAHDFKSYANELKRENYDGLNVTIPFKEEAFEYCDILSEDAKKANSVNTIHFDSKIIGYTTDGKGFVKDLENNDFYSENKRILIIGAGGSARSIVTSLIQQNPEQIVITNRNIARLSDFARRIGSDIVTVHDIHNLGKDYDLVVNATPTSLNDELPGINSEVVEGSLCYDLAYSYSRTKFCTWSEQNKAKKSIDGLGMLVEQAAESFRIWTGCKVSTQEIIKTMKQYIR